MHTHTSHMAHTSRVLSFADRTLRFILATILATASLAVLAAVQASAAPVQGFVAIYDEDENTVTLTWTPFAGATSYEVDYVRPNIGFAQLCSSNEQAIASVAATSVTAYGKYSSGTCTAFTPGEAIDFGVTANNSDRASLSLILEEGVVAAPANLTAVLLDNDTVTLSWTTPATAGVTGYNVYQIGRSLLGNTEGTTYTVPVSNLDISGGAVNFAVYPVISGEEGPSAATFYMLYETESAEEEDEQTIISDDAPSQDYVVGAGTVVLTGTRDNVTVLDGATLKGTGTAAAITAQSGATVAPGLSPGTLTALYELQLQAGSTLEIEILNKDTYDKLVVGQDIPGGTTAVSLDGAILRALAYEGLSIAAGDTFTIIDNLSDQPVNGTFKDLPEGATFPFGEGGVLSISYVGGDGNDVVLTVVTVPTAPDTGFAGLAANLASPAVIAVFTVLSALALVVIARRAARQ